MIIWQGAIRQHCRDPTAASCQLLLSPTAFHLHFAMRVMTRHVLGVIHVDGHTALLLEDTWPHGPSAHDLYASRVQRSGTTRGEQEECEAL
jgi:hypothetical protein